MLCVKQKLLQFVCIDDPKETFNEKDGASFADVILSYVFGWNSRRGSAWLKGP
jgi:hypothetical protein